MTESFITYISLAFAAVVLLYLTDRMYSLDRIFSAFFECNKLYEHLQNM